LDVQVDPPSTARPFSAELAEDSDDEELSAYLIYPDDTELFADNNHSPSNISLASNVAESEVIIV
jgi:hypothetical protein